MADGGDPLRVGFVVYGRLDERSGGYLYDRRLVDYLLECGLDVDIVSLPERPYRRSIATNFLPGLADRLRACDVVIQDAYCHPSLLVCNRRVPETPVLALVHYLRSEAIQHPERTGSGRGWRSVEHPLRRRVVTDIERTYLRSVDGYIHNSGATRDAVAALVGSSPEDLTDIVAPPAGDRLGADATWSDERTRREPARVVSVCNVTPRKGVTTLIEGLSRVEEPWELWVIGDTSIDPGYVATAEALARERGIADRVSFFGRVDDERLREALGSAQLLAVPSRYEPFGIVYLEGMAFGLPAVASAHGGASDFVDETNGALVPPEDPAAVAAAIGPMLRDRDRLARMSRAARATFNRHPTWTETCERIRRFIVSLAK